MLDDWVRDLADALGVDLPTDSDTVLDLAGDAARSVMRPAAPLTTFLVGYAAGRAGGGPDEVARAVAVARELASGWSGAAPS